MNINPMKYVMKRTFFTFLSVLLACSLYAITPITQEGTFNVKRCKGAAATFYIDWDKTMCGEIDEGVFVRKGTPINIWLKQRDELKIADGKPEDANYVKDWIAIQAECVSYFKSEWNGEFGKKGLRLTNNADEAIYHLNIVIDGLDWGGTAGSMFGWGNAGGAVIIGHIDIIERATGKLVTRFNLRHVQGSGHFTDRLRIILVFNQLVAEIEDLY